MSWKTLNRMLNTRCLNMFGEPIVYIPSIEDRPEFEGRPVHLTGIFGMKNGVMALTGSDFEVDVARHAVEIRVQDLGMKPMAGDEVQGGGFFYRVLEVQPSSDGVSVLILARQPDETSV